MRAAFWRISSKINGVMAKLHNTYVFSSIVITWPEEASDNSDTFRIEQFVDWMKSYDEKFKSHVVEIDRLDLLYHRNLSIIAAGAARTRHLAQGICPAARELGLATIVHVRVQDFAGETASFEDFVQLCHPGSIVLDAREAKFTGSTGIGRELADAVLSGDVALTLVGSPAYWRSMGLFDTVAFNSKQPTIIYRPDPGDPPHPARLAKTEAGGRKKACRTLFRLFVTPDGLIYPCQGLAGSQQLAIGSLSHVDLATHVGPDRLVELAENGPAISDSELQTPDTPGSPLACRLHRVQLEAKHSQRK